METYNYDYDTVSLVYQKPNALRRPLSLGFGLFLVALGAVALFPDQIQILAPRFKSWPLVQGPGSALWFLNLLYLFIFGFLLGFLFNKLSYRLFISRMTKLFDLTYGFPLDGQILLRTTDLNPVWLKENIPNSQITKADFLVIIKKVNGV